MEGEFEPHRARSRQDDNFPNALTLELPVKPRVSTDYSVSSKWLGDGLRTKGQSTNLESFTSLHLKKK